MGGPPVTGTPVGSGTGLYNVDPLYWTNVGMSHIHVLLETSSTQHSSEATLSSTLIGPKA